MWNRLFAPFEGRRSATPIAIFRISFFFGLALHFGPSLLWLDETYAPDVVRQREWSHWLFHGLARLPPGLIRVASIVILLALALGVLGLWTRAAAIVAGVGLYLFASFNAIQVQTLAIVDAWAILLLWMICGGGDRALSIGSLIKKHEGPATEPRLLSSLIAYQILLVVFSSGVEKLLAGWPGTNELHVVLSYPKGFIVRDWVAATAWLHDPRLDRALGVCTLIVELGAPIGLLFRRTRLIALVLWEIFFLGIVVMLEVPPLFYCMFAPGPLLLLEER